MDASVYDRVGGFSAVRKVVSEFYDRVLEEESLAPFFSETDMATLIDHQTKFWSALMGGPASYSEQQLLKVHESMGIRDRHFDRLAEIVVETLEDHDFDDENIDALVEKLNTYRSVIVSQGDDG
jgi:hemoglobin